MVGRQFAGVPALRHLWSADGADALALPILSTAKCARQRNRLRWVCLCPSQDVSELPLVDIFLSQAPLAAALREGVHRGLEGARHICSLS